jgi:hypothetical protein
MPQDQLVLTQKFRFVTPSTSKYTPSFFRPNRFRAFAFIPGVGTESAALHLRFMVGLSLARDSSSLSPLAPSPSRRAKSHCSTSTDTTSAAPELCSRSMMMCGPASLIGLFRTTGYQENALRGHRHEVFSATQRLAREQLRARIRSNESFSCLKPLERQVDLPLPVAFFVAARLLPVRDVSGRQSRRKQNPCEQKTSG